MLQTYKVKMSLTGRLTQLPDSQKIFGALIHTYADYYCSAKASELVAKVRDGGLYIALSNLLPEGYFPSPQGFLLDQLAQTAYDVGQHKIIYKAIKRREYVTEEQLGKLLIEPQAAQNMYPYVSLHVGQQIHASIDAVRYDMPGLPPNLYSVPETTILERQNEHGDERIITQFCFYLAMEQNEDGAGLLEVLSEAQNNGHLFFLGPRASQGLNTYRIDKIQRSELLNDTTTTYLNLGMLLPQDIDYERSYLQLFTSERRPYNASEGWSKQLNGKFISYIEAGSLIYTEYGLRGAGKSIPSPFQSRDIVFGNAILFPVKVEGGEQIECS